MRKTSIPNKLSTNRKPIHGDQRVCKENKEKNDCQLKYLAVKRSNMEGCRRTVTRLFRMKLATRIVYNIKGFINITVN